MAATNATGLDVKQLLKGLHKDTKPENIRFNPNEETYDFEPTVLTTIADLEPLVKLPTSVGNK